MKYLLLVLVLGLLWRAWKKRQAVPPPAAHSTERPVAAMRQCTHCGVHFPEEDGVAEGGRPFCSSAHREAFRQR